MPIRSDGWAATHPIALPICSRHIRLRLQKFLQPACRHTEKILDYKLTVYVCEGEESEKLEWFQTINIAGKPLNEQEIRNAIYAGPFVSDAKRHFSKTNCGAYRLGKDLVNGTPIRQDFLKRH